MDGDGLEPAVRELRARLGTEGVVGGVPLGTEVPWLLADLRGGIDPDAMAAGVGAVVGGGEVLLVHDGVARTGFERRLLASLGRVPPPTGREPPPPSDPRFATADQERAFAAGLRALERPRTVVVLADRGRGKSTLLGLLGARLAERRAVRVTAPERASAEALLRALGEDAVFVPPDRVDEVEGDPIWLVDEAAALPPGLVLRLADRARRLVLATTVHGYEGTGRSFELRLLPRLRRPVVLRLHEPARHAPDDPVEAWLRDLFLLDAEPEEGGAGPLVVREARPDDERELRAVFGLMVRAHYRTRPSDLARWVDGAHRAIVAEAGGVAVGAAMLAEEGGWTTERAERVADGGERPRGDLIPEVLAVHLARPDLATLRARRIVRIAVRDDQRRRGVGRALLAAAETGAELCGASFAADPAILRFWTSAGHRLVRLGAGPSALRPSMLVLKGAGPAAIEVEALGRRAGRDLPHALRELAVEPSVAVAALRATPRDPADLDDADLRELERCARGARHWEWSARALFEVAAGPPEGADAQVEIVVARVLLGWDWDRLARWLRVPHRTEAVRAARAALATVIAATDLSARGRPGCRSGRG